MPNPCHCPCPHHATDPAYRLCAKCDARCGIDDTKRRHRPVRHTKTQDRNADTLAERAMDLGE